MTAVLIFVAFLWPPDYYPHYAWFFSLSLARSLALPAARLAGAFTSAEDPPGNRPRRARPVAAFTLAAAAVAAAAGAHQFRELSAQRSGDLAPPVRRDTPAGGCVLADIPAVTILSDRFMSSMQRCSPMVDPIGTSYARAGGRNGLAGAGRTLAVQKAWRSAFAAAQYVWLQCPPWTRPRCLTSRRVPWTGSLRGYFAGHFEPVRDQGAVPNLVVRRRP